MRYYYATFNYRADLIHGNHGFANTWTIARFESPNLRDAFVEKESNRKSRKVSRDEAVKVLKNNYWASGMKVPDDFSFHDKENFYVPT